MSNTPYQPVFTNTNPYAAANDAPRDTQYYTPETEHLQLHDDLPAGAAAPRFMGAASQDNRTSFASSRPTLQGDDVAMKDGSKAGFYSLNYTDSDLNTSQANFATEPYRSSPYLNEKSAYPAKKSRKKAIFIGAAVVAAVIAAVVIGVYFGVTHKSDKNSTSGNTSSGNSSNSDSGGDNGNSGSTKTNLVVSGGDGSTVTMDDGSTFTYQNSFGGSWYYDPANPLTSGARAQSWTPALNETFKFGEDNIRGVNVGGWLVTEPFIVPSLYEKYVNTSTPAFDEWDLTTNMAADGSLSDLENHYKTFITEKDFADIAAAGLNFVRIPIPYWAIEVREKEPFLPKTSWTYFLKAVQWARKYGLRINLDLHSLPGSQNGWNHSGRLGQINVLYGPMGVPNAQRSLDYIRIIAEFISQPEYSDVVVMFGITNEPFGPTIGKDVIKQYYVKAYQTVREASGTGEGQGPWMVMHDAFLGLTEWKSFLPNGDRVQLDIHQYLCFDGQSADDYSVRVAAGQPCTAWATGQNDSMTNFGMTHVGEFSMAINDCGLWVNGVNLGARFDGSFTASHFDKTGDCSTYTDYTTYDDAWKASMQQFALQSMSALQNWFFWTWKIGNSTVSGRVESPAWSYQLGLQEGWMPKDPRLSEGACDNSDPFNPPLQAWQTGGSGAGDVPQTFLDSFTWPPTSLTNLADVATAPQYTATGTIVTLPAPSITASGTASVNLGNGWNNPSDTAQMFVPIATCGYLDPWMGPSASPAACPPLSTTAAARRAYITPPPSRR
ncbi:glycoside hydrolase [Lentinus tigrinus ALCF2SS1-7]|uniref:glucan 1,3-beta-glucosidase n=1 Tax=Lentinus tigrinus ALCF2SS1-6 TaxID=1328759 RepID=A0A5C2STB5_9APHY|nr:glycoside hydrolase [Lentinus tigrinus ALCF2SS1-6]RPD80261.1 glycoside hydrolase [Lentinus tigrinus ALCF2SS1-7]